MATLSMTSIAQSQVGGSTFAALLRCQMLTSVLCVQLLDQSQHCKQGARQHHWVSCNAVVVAKALKDRARCLYVYHDGLLMWSEGSGLS